VDIGKAARNSVFGLVIAGVAGNVPAFADAAGSRMPGEGGRQSGSGLVYTDTALSQAIYSYLNLKGAGWKVENAQIVYVDQAYGQAIYSYPRVGRDIVAAFNIRYVNQAYGPAIYSYPGLDDRFGRVEVLPP
jgi:hypothetical protein